MNEDKISDYLRNYIESINDMKTPAFIEYKEKFERHNRGVITKHIPLFSRVEIQIRNYFSGHFFNISGIFLKNNIVFSYSRIKLGRSKILVPIEINCTMESILTKDLHVSGLFRRSTTVSNLQECHSLIRKCLKKNMSKLDIINNLLNFDLITLTSVYRQLFDHFSMPLIPKWYLKSFVKVSEIESETEKIILLKYIIYSIPKSNRNLLESLTQFFSLIQYLIEDTETETPINMDMHGFAVVMMPKIFIQKNYSFDLADLNKLIDVLEFIFEKKNILFSIGVERKEENGISYINYFDLGNQENINHNQEIGISGEDFEQE